jgi:hypothetical protein
MKTSLSGIRSTKPERLRRWLVLFLCLFVVGCSATRLVYNQLDWVIVWSLNGFFDLNDEQETQLRDSVARNLEWHRRTQLPRYAEFLRELDREFAGNVSVETLARRYDETIVFWDEFILHAIPDISVFFLSLDQTQIDDFLENLEDHNSELWDEYAGETAESRIRRRERAAIKNTRRVIGRLDAEQEDLIRVYMSQMHDLAAEWMEGRRAWQAEFHDLIMVRPPEPEFSRRLELFMIEPNRGDQIEYRRKVEENRQTVFEMCVALIEQMNDKQRARLSKRLNGFAKDFEILSVQEE